MKQIVVLAAVTVALLSALFYTALQESEQLTPDRLFLQAPAPPDVPEFPGQPTQCDNSIQTPESHRCHCARDEQKCHGLPEPPSPVAMDKRCLTYCRQQHCECRGSGCRS